ncbi:methyltransferase domain-containing protein [bacterium]|nr:methyltransferase domain-containing protein [bacterium]
MFCPICKFEVDRFLPFGKPERKNARCPVCGSLERHRFIWIAVCSRTNLLDPDCRKILDFGPNKGFEAGMKTIPDKEYLTADLKPGRAQMQIDVTNIKFPDDTFDAVFCSHVLEHVPNDRRAISEIRRVLKPTGFSLIAVPMTTAMTFEDPNATTPEERKRLYGIADHVRRYGPDFEDRLKEAGFKYTLLKPTDIIPDVFLKLIGVPYKLPGVYLCLK